MFRTTRSAGKSRGGPSTLAIAGLLLSAGPSLAAVQQFYTSKAAFLTAISPMTAVQEDFDTATTGLVPNPGLSLAYFDMVPVYNNTNYLYIDSGAGALNVDGTRYVWADVRSPGSPTFQFDLVFDQPVHAFGADYRSALSASGVALQDQDGNLLTDFYQDWSVIGTGFFGFTLTEPITKLRFLAGSAPGNVVENFGMDNVVLAVPEPATALLLAGAFVVTRLRRGVGKPAA